MDARLDNPSISTATSIALGVVASFNLVYSSPVIISTVEELSANVDRLSILGILITVSTSIAVSYFHCMFPLFQKSGKI